MRRLQYIIMESKMNTPSVPSSTNAPFSAPPGYPGAPRHKPRLTEDRNLQNLRLLIKKRGGASNRSHPLVIKGSLLQQFVLPMSSEKPQSLTTPKIIATSPTPGTSPPVSPEEEKRVHFAEDVRDCCAPSVETVVLEPSTRTQPLTETEIPWEDERQTVQITVTDECNQFPSSSPAEVEKPALVFTIPRQSYPPRIMRVTKVQYNTNGRKQSNSDLQSRLKTRKLLGVGELNGSEETTIYKSKISQLLGINESLYVKLPRGLMYWNSVNAVYFYVFGTLYMLAPSFCAQLEFGVPLDEGALFGRLYGCILIILGITFRNFLTERESRADVAFMLLAVAAMHLLQLIVMATSGSFHLLAALVRLAVIVGNVVYHAFVDSQGGLHRQFFRWLDGNNWFSQYHAYESSPARSVVRERLVASKTADEDETISVPSTSEVIDTVAGVASTVTSKASQVAAAVTDTVSNSLIDLEDQFSKPPAAKKSD